MERYIFDNVSVNFVGSDNDDTELFVARGLGPSALPGHDAVQSQDDSFHNSVVQRHAKSLSTRCWVAFKHGNSRGGSNANVLIAALHSHRDHLRPLQSCKTTESVRYDESRHTRHRHRHIKRPLLIP
mmetsp:Transcript_30216/g.40343  ORF Transcript_30216/g.40343 Transcript_30216/m.40343 type:complete len:127 (-) Transcript_30216:106-486(-)